jgi:hypothetical protein
MNTNTKLVVLVVVGFVSALYGFFDLQKALMSRQSPLVPILLLFGGVVTVVIADMLRRYHTARKDNPVKREIDALLLKEELKSRKKP